MQTITRILIFLLSINLCLFSNEFSKKSKNQIKQKISSHQNQIFKNQTIKKLIQQKSLLNNNQRDECEDGFIDDCSGDGDCCPESWVGDGYLDCEDPNNYGCDLTCYDNDGGDCEENSDDGGTDGGGDDGSESDCDAIGGNEAWVGDAWCDNINNNETCGFDGGDCCYSTCVSSVYDCEADSGPCLADICIDPDGNNDDCSNEGGDDGGDSGGEDECQDGYVDDCSGDGDCCPETWIGDSLPDCEDQSWGCDLSCYDDDGGDCEEGGDDGEEQGCVEGNEWYCLGCELWISDCEYYECTDNGWSGPYSNDECGDDDDGGDDGGDNSIITITIGDSSGILGEMPGEGIQYGTEVPLFYQSSESIGGIQFTISDSPNWATGIEMSSVFEECFTPNFNDVNENFIGILFSLEGCELEPSESSVHFATITYILSEDASWGEEIGLSFADAIVSDGVGNSLSVDTNGNTINISLLGDVSSDSELNVLDVVTLINFILFIDEPTDYQHWAGDVNADAALNVLDVVIIVDMILED